MHSRFRFVVAALGFFAAVPWQSEAHFDWQPLDRIARLVDLRSDTADCGAETPIWAGLPPALEGMLFPLSGFIFILVGLGVAWRGKHEPLLAPAIHLSAVATAVSGAASLALLALFPEPVSEARLAWIAAHFVPVLALGFTDWQRLVRPALLYTLSWFVFFSVVGKQTKLMRAQWEAQVAELGRDLRAKERAEVVTSPR